MAKVNPQITRDPPHGVRDVVVETEHLQIASSLPMDEDVEQYYLKLNPIILHLDPPVGESRSPLMWAVIVREDSKLIGKCCLYNPTPAAIELGVRIFASEYWNMGYGKEIINALCLYVSTFMPERSVILAKTPVYNHRAIRCYTGCGFSQYGKALIGGFDMVLLRKEVAR